VYCKNTDFTAESAEHAELLMKKAQRSPRALRCKRSFYIAYTNKDTIRAFVFIRGRFYNPDIDFFGEMLMKNRVYILIILLTTSLLFACGQKQATPTATDTPQPTAPPQPTSAPTGEVVISPERIAAAQEFVDLLVKGDYASAEEKLDDTMKTALPASKMDELWSSLQKQAGAYQQQTGVHTDRTQGYDVVFVTCQFEQALLDVKVVFNASGQIAGLFFLPALPSTDELPAYEPPAYVKTDSFQEQDVTVGSGEWALPGTLTLPAGAGPFPAVVLVHGSGPNDRDETVGPNKPFRDLAWGLASQGIAVLRYEKRTKQYPEKMAAIQNTLTVKEETVDDALAAVELLRQQQKIDPQRIFMLGHSLGGMLLPRIGAADAKIAGLIALAGLTRPLEDTILEQATYLVSLDGDVSEKEQSALDKLTEQAARVKDPQLDTSVPASDLPLNISASYWLDLRGYVPAEAAKTLTQPMLILQGGRDYQVTTVDFDIWKTTLSSRANVQLTFYADLNHLFITGQGSPNPDEYMVPGHVYEQVINDIAAWIKGIIPE
jgi:dienelactone hydrolase